MIEDSGFELAELTAPVVGGRQIIRIYIYSQNGVTLGDCTRISRQVSDRLDTDDPVAGRYSLEVSSLGLDRSLTSARDFRRRIGERIAVTYDDGSGRKTVEGLLKECNGSSIKIEMGETIVDVPVDADPRGKILI